MDLVNPNLPCPREWEYKNVENYSATLQSRTKELLIKIRQANKKDKLRNAADTRVVHAHFFNGLTPPNFPYFAGHYRGEQFRCLQTYEVHIKSDKRVGHQSVTIPMEMEEFHRRVFDAVDLIDAQNEIPTTVFSDAEKLANYVRVITALFVEFLEIHPYANGNGHMARMLILLLLGRLGLYPNTYWTIDPRPADPPYTNLISRYRDGDKLGLEEFILNAL